MLCSYNEHDKFLELKFTCKIGSHVVYVYSSNDSTQMSFNFSYNKEKCNYRWDEFIFNHYQSVSVTLHYNFQNQFRLTLSIYYLNLFQRTSLHDAAEKGDVETLKNLGEDINIKDKAGVCKSVLLVHL